MAIMNPKTALEKETVSSFGGISDHAGLTSDNAFDMRNFQILPDGSLEKRCGFFKRYSFGTAIRGLWEGTVSGNTYFFVVAGAQIYRQGPNDGFPTAVYMLTTSEGNVNFAFYRENLYVLDGKSLLIFRPSTETFSIAEGYVPLYGYNWHPSQLGEINEQLNLIQSRIRIHYLNTNGSTTFQLPFTCEKINGMTVNGTPTVLYSFTPYTSTFTIPASLSSVGTLEVTVTLDPIFVRRSTVLQASEAAVFSNTRHHTMMTFGGDQGYLIYRSTPVTDEMMEQCLIACSDADPLYFQKDKTVTVGSSQHPVEALCQFEEQMLVFNDENVWGIRYPSGDSDEIEMIPIRAALGCASRNGVLPCGDFLATVSDGGILRMDIQGDDFDICKTSSLSRAIERRLDADFLNRAVLFRHKAKNQLWVRDPAEASGLVWIYDADRKLWFSYDGIRANRFYEVNGEVAFSTDSGEICYFDEALDCDDGVAYSAFYQSHYVSFSHPHFAKRALRLSVCAQTNGGSLTAEITTERGSKSFVWHKNTGDVPAFFDRRLSKGRFRFLQFRLSASDAARCRIYSLSIAANN